MSAVATKPKKTAKTAPAVDQSGDTQPAISQAWAAIAQSGVNRVCEVLYQAEQAADYQDPPPEAHALMSQAESVLYFMAHAPLTDSLWVVEDPMSALSLIRCALSSLRRAIAMADGLNDVQVAVAPVAVALLRELEVALFDAPKVTARLEGFATFMPRPEVQATTPPPAPSTIELPPDDAKRRLALAQESNHEVEKLAEAMERLLRQRRDEDFLIYHGMLTRIQQLSTITYFAMRIHGDSPEKEDHNWGDLSKIETLEAAYRGLL